MSLYYLLVPLGVLGCMIGGQVMTGASWPTIRPLVGFLLFVEGGMAAVVGISQLIMRN